MAEWLAGIAARNLGTPLTILRLTAESLLRTWGDASAASPDQVRTLLHQLHSVEAVFRDLLSVAHPPALNPQRMSLNGVVQEMVDVFAPAAAARQNPPEVTLDLSDPEVRADPDHLREVCFILFAAALAAAAGGSPFEVRTHRRNGWGELSIKHQIDERDGASSTPSSSDGRRGAGDLLRVWQVVRRHGGSFQVQVDPQRNRSFAVTLPLVESYGILT